MRHRRPPPCHCHASVPPAPSSRLCRGAGKIHQCMHGSVADDDAAAQCTVKSVWQLRCRSGLSLPLPLPLHCTAAPSLHCRMHGPWSGAGGHALMLCRDPGRGSSRARRVPQPKRKRGLARVCTHGACPGLPRDVRTPTCDYYVTRSPDRTHGIPTQHNRGVRTSSTVAFRWKISFLFCILVALFKQTCYSSFSLHTRVVFFFFLRTAKLETILYSLYLLFGASRANKVI